MWIWIFFTLEGINRWILEFWSPPSSHRCSTLLCRQWLGFCISCIFVFRNPDLLLLWPNAAPFAAATSELPPVMVGNQLLTTFAYFESVWYGFRFSQLNGIYIVDAIKIVKFINLTGQIFSTRYSPGLSVEILARHSTWPKKTSWESMKRRRDHHHKKCQIFCKSSTRKIMFCKYWREFLAGQKYSPRIDKVPLGWSSQKVKHTISDRRSFSDCLKLN